MSFVATAVVGAAVIGAGATIAASSNSANAIKSSTNASINAQQAAQQQQQALNAPYANIGTGGAIAQYQNLLGLSSGSTPGTEEAALAGTPGYQFAKSQGLNATLNAATLTNPGGVTGNTLTALDQFSTGLADQTYQQAVGNAQNAVTIGQNAAAGTGSGILQTGANVGNTISGAGNTIAGIDANEAAGLAKTASGAAGNLVTLNTLNNLNTTDTTTPTSSGTNWTGNVDGGYGVTPAVDYTGNIG